MNRQKMPQIGDRITARHLRHSTLCDALHQKEVHGYVHSIGTYVLYVVDADTIVAIHSQNGWEVHIHPEVTKEE